MKKLLIVLILIASYTGCKKEIADTAGVKVVLIPNDDIAVFNKSVILFNDDNYLIKTPLDTFLLGYPFRFIDGYEEMKVKAINDAITKDVLIVSDYMHYRGDSVFTLAYHLEEGSCYLLDKKTNKSITSIKVEPYMNGGPMTTTGGRRFYIKNKLFFETIDLISK